MYDVSKQISCGLAVLKNLSSTARVLNRAHASVPNNAKAVGCLNGVLRSPTSSDTEQPKPPACHLFPALPSPHSSPYPHCALVRGQIRPRLLARHRLTAVHHAMHQRRIVREQRLEVLDAGVQDATFGSELALSIEANQMPAP